MLKNIKKVLVLAPHTDDGEFGCGGTISRLIREGVEVHYAAFSTCAKSVPKTFPSNILEKEVKSATSVLGIKPENLYVFDFEVREFSYSRQKILDELIVLRNRVNPDIVFIPSINDVHQDHSTVAIEAVRAFKFHTLLSYELIWNNLSFNNTCYFKLEEIDINQKIQAIGMYVSQKHRGYSDGKIIESIARTRGVQINSIFAEVFEVIRLSI